MLAAFLVIILKIFLIYFLIILLIFVPCCSVLTFPNKAVLSVEAPTLTNDHLPAALPAVYMTNWVEMEECTLGNEMSCIRAGSLYGVYAACSQHC